MIEKTPPQGAQAVLRAISLLKSFTVKQPERTLSSLCREQNLTRTTTHRLLSALVAEDLLERDGSIYRLGSAALALGTIATECLDLREWVRPLLDQLAKNTGETATLEVLVDGEMMILDEVPSGSLMAPSGNIGTRWPLHATATGKLVMALDPDVKKILASDLHRYTDLTCTDHEALRAQIDRARAQGYATAMNELEESYAAVAIPVPGNLAVSHAALSVGGPTERLRRKGSENIVKMMREAVRSLSMENSGVISAKAV